MKIWTLTTLDTSVVFILERTLLSFRILSYNVPVKLRYCELHILIHTPALESKLQYFGLNWENAELRLRFFCAIHVSRGRLAIGSVSLAPKQETRYHRPHWPWMLDWSVGAFSWHRVCIGKSMGWAWRFTLPDIPLARPHRHRVDGGFPCHPFHDP